MADNCDDNGGWILLIFIILLLGPCTATQENESEINEQEKKIEQLELEIQELKSERLD